MTSRRQCVLFLEGQRRATVCLCSAPFTIRGQAWDRLEDFDAGFVFYDYLLVEKKLAGFRFWITDPLTSEQRSFWQILCMDGRGAEDRSQGFVDLWVSPDINHQTREIAVDVVQDFGGESPLHSGRLRGLAVEVPDALEVIQP